jgi:hypothetical protein
MAKEFYKVTYKTLHYDRVKPVTFRDTEVFPLYIQITYDRKTTYFKSSFFEIFQQPKYDYLNVSLQDIEQLETATIDFIVNRFSETFSLDQFRIWYPMFSQDVLDSLDAPFKSWFSIFLSHQNFTGFSNLIQAGIEKVSALQILEETKNIFSSDLYTQMMEKAVKDAPPFIPLSLFILTQKKKGPFSLPLHEWVKIQNSQELDDFLRATPECWGYDILRIIREIKQLLYPKGFD